MLRLLKFEKLVTAYNNGKNKCICYQNCRRYDLVSDIDSVVSFVTGMRFTNGLFPTTAIRLPSVYNFLPHLLDDPTSLRPAYLLSKGRSYVSMVLGIPTVKRDKQSYLMDTLQNLLEAINEDEAMDTIIVVFVAEVSDLPSAVSICGRCFLLALSHSE